jgi:hypothetical protein
MNNGKGKILIDDITAPLVKKLYALCAEGRHTLDELKKLATAFGLVSKRFKRPLVVSNVHRILTNAFYYGVFFYKGELFHGAHEPIITKELYDKAQEALAIRCKPTLYKNHYFAFRGLISCGECGCVITAEGQKGHAYYHCTKRKAECSQKGYIREEKLALMISEAIAKVGIDDKTYDAMIAELDREKELAKATKIHNDMTRETRTREIDEQLSRLLDLFVDGAVSADEYNAKKASLINKKTHHLENPVGTDGKWLEPMRDFLTLAHQASYVARAGSAEEKADYIKKICSNRRLAYASLSYSYIYPYKILAERQESSLGSLYQKVRTYFKGSPLK